MRVSFLTLGCKVNQYETQALRALFEKEGHQLVSDEEPADVCIVNSCSVTNMADRKSRQMIRKMKKNNPDCIIAVTGCYAQTGTQALEEMPEVDIIAGTNEKTGLPQMVEEFAREQTRITRVLEYGELGDFDEMGVVEAMEGRTRAFIKIQEGCNRFCSYCIIPYARGTVRSRREEDILEEARHLLEAGYRELVLTGINTALYGSEDDGEPKLDRLIEKISGLGEGFRIRLSSLEPTVINEEYVRRLFPYDKLCRHVHLSVQSGSDKVLRDMNRRYDRQEYLNIVRALKEFDPDYGISTDIIVGFPGETEEDFEQSMEIARECGFCKVHVFRYSPRKGTPAAKRTDQVPSKEKNRRSELLLKAGEKAAEAFLERNIGKTRPVLLEEYLPEEGAATGYTDNYLKVYVKVSPGDAEAVLNTIRQIRITGEFLDGAEGVLE